MRMYLWQGLKLLCLVIALTMLGHLTVWGEEQKNWFAVAGSFLEEKNAQDFAKRLLDQKYRPEIYLSENGYFAVTLGGYLERDQAKKLVEQAKQEKIALDAYIWQSDLWGANRFEPTAGPPVPGSSLPPLAEIQQQLSPVFRDPKILRPRVSRTAHLSIFQPTMTLSSDGRQLLMNFPFVYTLGGAPQSYYLKTDQGKGSVEVIADIKSEGRGPILGNVRLVAFAEKGLPAEIQKTLQSDWLGYLRKNLEGKSISPQ